MPQLEKPSVIQKPTPNYWVGRNGQKIVAICDHIDDSSSPTSTIDWFASPESGVSSHFLVAKSGVIYQFVDVKDTAFTNGIVGDETHRDRSVAWLEDAIKRGINPNRLTITIEHEGRGGQTLTEPQYQATLALHKWLINVFNITIDRTHIIGHYQVDSKNKPNCPGGGFPWVRLMNDLTTFFKPVEQPPQPQVIVVNNYQLGHGFLDYWRANGEAKGVLGNPISNEYLHPRLKLTVQAFEYGVLVYNPKQLPDKRVTRLAIGVDWFAANKLTTI